MCKAKWLLQKGEELAHTDNINKTGIFKRKWVFRYIKEFWGIWDGFEGCLKYFPDIGVLTWKLGLILLPLCQNLIILYGSVSAGREFWLFRVTFFLKVEPSCD